jgi:hypothetical protein
MGRAQLPKLCGQGTPTSSTPIHSQRLPCPLLPLPSIPGYGRIDADGVGVNAAGDVFELGEPLAC